MKTDNTPVEGHPEEKHPTGREWEEEFDFKFYGQVNCVDDTGGYDAKPYLKMFIKKLLASQREKDIQELEEKRQREEAMQKYLGFTEKDYFAGLNAAIDYLKGKN